MTDVIRGRIVQTGESELFVSIGVNVVALYRQIRKNGLSADSVISIMDAVTSVDSTSFQNPHKDERAIVNADISPQLADEQPTISEPRDSPETEDPILKNLPDQPVSKQSEKPIASEPQPLPEANKPISAETIRNSLNTLLKSDRDKAKEILNKYGAESVSDLDQQYYPIVMVEIRNALSQ